MTNVALNTLYLVKRVNFSFFFFFVKKMFCQLPTDCLNDIFETLEEDKITLRSCLLVNRLWCEISVRFLWKNIWSFKYKIAYRHRSKVISAILSTLIACLPNESKEFLYK